ncbi:TonB-dependent receptor [Balneolales bacterium ANBcel1]|nr:TonB-dependent receptor [Balneolales bacterium ANBcel1]
MIRLVIIAVLWTWDLTPPGHSFVDPPDSTGRVFSESAITGLPAEDLAFGSTVNDAIPADTIRMPGAILPGSGQPSEVPADTARVPGEITPGSDQPSEAPADTTRIPGDIDSDPDRISDVPADTIPDPTEPVELEPVELLEVRTPSQFREETTDSLLRWQLWSDLGEWVSRRPGVISSQLDGQGRNDGFLFRAHENRHQLLYSDGVRVNERIFGSANHKRLPHYGRIASVHTFSAPIRHRTDVTTVRYHVARPLTLINYEQTAFNYRSTEGYLTRNIRPGTNLSIAYWGKNEDEGYRNNFMGGRNASVTAYHYLTESWILEGGYRFSGLQFGEPHGYDIADMAGFAFNRFNVFPIESQARSSMRNSVYRLTAYHREQPDLPATTRLTVYHDRYRRLHYGSVDSSSVRTFTTGFSGRHIRDVGPLELQAELESEWSAIDRDRHQTMDKDSWAYNRAKGVVRLPLPNRSALHSWLQTAWRTDGFTDYELGTRAEWRLARGLMVYASYARGEQMPQPGQLYWRGGPMRGNPDLRNEIIQRAETGAQINSRSWQLGAEAFASRIDNPVLAGLDSTFTQAGSYTSAGAAGWISYDGTRFEFSLSGTFHQYLSDDSRTENRLLDQSGQRAWTRFSFYYKNYIYNSAAFMKTGFYLQVSPIAYRSARYYPEIDYWDPNSLHPNPGAGRIESQAIPEFARLDLELTARVRSAIFLLRMENALDNWLQQGYFETAYQPMPARRLRFGVRWVLRN